MTDRPFRTALITAAVGATFAALSWAFSMVVFGPAQFESASRIFDDEIAPLMVQLSAADELRTSIGHIIARTGARVSDVSAAVPETAVVRRGYLTPAEIQILWRIARANADSVLRDSVAITALHGRPLSAGQVYLVTRLEEYLGTERMHWLTFRDTWIDHQVSVDEIVPRLRTYVEASTRFGASLEGVYHLSRSQYVTDSLTAERAQRLIARYDRERRRGFGRLLLAGGFLGAFAGLILSSPLLGWRGRATGASS